MVDNDSMGLVYSLSEPDSRIFF